MKELAAALAAVQADLHALKPDSVNPKLGNRYVSLGAVIEAVRPVLAAHKISVVQTFAQSEQGTVLVTTLLHASGESLESRFPLPPADSLENRGVNAVQALGSAISYVRRYSLLAILSLAQDDNDASGSSRAASAPPPARAVSPQRKEAEGRLAAALKASGVVKPAEWLVAQTGGKRRREQLTDEELAAAIAAAENLKEQSA